MNSATFSGPEFWIWLAVSSAIATASLYYGFRWLHRARVIEDTPTARIRSAQQGYVELNGQAWMMPGTPVTAPLTGTPCCWYRYRIEKKGNKNWRTLESDTSDELFLLRDETGECLIDPEGAEVTPGSRSVWYGGSRYPQQRQPASQPIGKTPLWRLGNILNQDIGFGGRYRYTEERIHDAMPLYALGLFKSQDELDRQQDQRDLTRGLLQAWKRDRNSLLEKFDLNRDGQIDSQEWEVVRKAAITQARLEVTQQTSADLNRLGAPDAGQQPFLISTLPQFDLVRRYRFKSAGGIALFFLSGAAAVWILNSQGSAV